MPTPIARPHRRQFVKAALVTAASYNRILGANDRIRIGAIGTGQRGQTLLDTLNQIGSNDIVALCERAVASSSAASACIPVGVRRLALQPSEIIAFLPKRVSRTQFCILVLIGRQFLWR